MGSFVAILYNNHRISLKLKGISPVQYRTHS
ncbi:MAG: IS3 family transposase, partial [Oscillospiraceae bacterium]|nr:IS3 family transposase [Oscillospiraceae bacterium]